MTQWRRKREFFGTSEFGVRPNTTVTNLQFRFILKSHVAFKGAGAASSREGPAEAGSDALPENSAAAGSEALPESSAEAGGNAISESAAEPGREALPEYSAFG